LPAFVAVVVLYETVEIVATSPAGVTHHMH
jgi:hypothetical protein